MWLFFLVYIFFLYFLHLTYLRISYMIPQVAPNFPFHNAENIPNLKEKTILDLLHQVNEGPPSCSNASVPWARYLLGWPANLQDRRACNSIGLFTIPALGGDFVLIKDWNFYSMCKTEDFGQVTSKDWSSKNEDQT